MTDLVKPHYQLEPLHETEYITIRWDFLALNTQKMHLLCCGPNRGNLQCSPAGLMEGSRTAQGDELMKSKSILYRPVWQ